MSSFYRVIISIGNALSPVFLLAVRLLWGYLFFISGLGKLLNPEPVIEFFTSLNIPFPALSMYAAGLAELVGGALLFIGFGARLAAIPLLFTMGVAFLTAHREALMHAVENPQDFLSQSPTTFFLAALIVFCFGPGLFSIDAFLKRVIGQKDPNQ